jgi:RsbT co-antagonist protein rsbRD N-terminal domain
MMILSKFILQNIETILQEWEDFAATLVPVEQKMDQAMLRDHGKQMLEAIAADLLRPETARKKADKSKGHGDAPGGKATAAKTHGADRLASGFTLNAAVAEYRALRASVIRLWQGGGWQKACSEQSH